MMPLPCPACQPPPSIPHPRLTPTPPPRRAGLLGLCAPLLILLMDTCNTFFYFNGLRLTGGTLPPTDPVLLGEDWG